jgi:CCR4-NOT transcription complex subunit 2
VEQLGDVDRWLRAVLWDHRLPDQDKDKEYDFEVHRTKGRLLFDNGDIKMLQGVREVFEMTDAPASDEPPPSEGKIILIGRGLGGADFEDSLKQILR